MKSLSIFFACFLLFGVWAELSAQVNSKTPSSNSKSNNNKTIPQDSVPPKSNPSTKPAIDSIKYFKQKALEATNTMLGFKAEVERLLAEKECKDVRNDNDKLKNDNEKLKGESTKVKEVNTKLQNEINSLKKELKDTTAAKATKVQRLNEKYEKDIQGFKDKITKIDDFIRNSAQKLSGESSTIIGSNPLDSVVVFDKIRDLTNQIAVLKNLSEDDKALDAIKSNIDDFGKFTKLISRANWLLTMDYFEVKDQVQSTIKQLETLLAQRAFQVNNQYVAPTITKLLNILKKYCITYEEAYYFYLNAQSWSYVADKEIDLFKTDLTRNPKIQLQIDSYPFIKAKLGQLKEIPERERKKPVNPFKKVPCS